MSEEEILDKYLAEMYEWMREAMIASQLQDPLQPEGV